jgi:diguanylate cyclase (GGDEF)-like protein/PAS domain S-box-containing protein
VGAALLAVALLCGVGWVASIEASRTVQSDAQGRVRSNRDAAVRALEHQTNDFKTMVATWAGNESVVNSLRGPTPATLGAVQGQLATLSGSKDSPSAFVTDISGRIVALHPSQPALIGQDFAFRDWFKGVTRTGKPYVSEAYRTAATGHPLVVAVAAPVRGVSGRLGYVAVLWQLDSVRALSQGARADDGVTITVTDQQGQPLTGTPRFDDRGQAIQAPITGTTRQALEGRSVDTVNDGMLEAAAPVPELGWTVTAALPASLALAPARSFQRSLGITLGVALLLVLAFPVLAWRFARRRAAEQTQAARNIRSLIAAEDLVRTVMASASIGIALADLDGSFRVVNASLCDLLGYDEAWFLEHRVEDVVHPDDAEDVLHEHDRFLTGSLDPGVTKMRLMRADGAVVWVRQVAVLIQGGEGLPNLLMLQVEDVTAENEVHEALAYQAFHDPLTGLHNRAWILDILKIDLSVAKRSGTTVGALFVDLDNFKVVNDSLGHATGDEVLTTVADRIVASLRPGDRVGRFGGDEFVIVVQDVQDPLEVEGCAERVSASIAADLQVHSHRIVPTASIGIATSTSTSTPDSLLRDADSALFRAKAAGRARWHLFDEAMHAQAVDRLTVEDQLRDAIKRGQFVVHYQPIVALADARVVGHEALVRWAHPTRGLLSPVDFLDVAEDTGLIKAIGVQVLDQACAMLDRYPDLPGAISVNVSTVQVAAPDWLRSMRDTLTRHRVDPARIVIEVTETAVLNLGDSARHAITSLHGLGVGIHVDDFGTGYSSISVLRDLPVTGVKLDLRFVHDLTPGDSQANALAQGLGGLVNGLHLTGIAEGIETRTQADILRAHGWQFGQGYYFGKPAAMPVRDSFTDGKSVAGVRRRTGVRKRTRAGRGAGVETWPTTSDPLDVVNRFTADR